MPPVPSFRTFQILYGALVASAFVYLVILFVAAPPPMPTTSPVLPIALAAAALGSAVASFVVPRVITDGAYRASAPAVVEVVAPDAEALFRDQVRTRRVFADPAAARVAILRAALAPFILRFALSESVALYGLVLGFTGHGLGLAMPFFFAAWVLFALHFPRERALYADAERRLGARFE